MAVEFQRGEFGAEFANQWRVDPPAIQALFEEMEEFDGSPRAARAILRRISDAADQFGVESVAPERNADGRELLHINTGDTYSGTVGYDVRREAFILTTWGGWLEDAEREIHEQGYPARDDEEACESCHLIWNVEQLEDGVCERCRPKPTPMWTPRTDQPLVTTLRSIEGAVLAVHLYDDHPASDTRYIPGPVLAFSIPLDDRFIASAAHDRWGGPVPYMMPLQTIADAFDNKKHDDLYVSGDGREARPTLGIEREMYSRLRVALDAFFEAGGVQPLRAFVETPPVLWTCDQINYIVWDEGEGGHNMPAAVEAFVATFEEGLGPNNPGPVHSDLSVWSATGKELAELIEDGFLKFGDDASLREYLGEIGVCRLPAGARSRRR